MENEVEDLDSQNQEEVVDENKEPGLPADPIEVEPVDEEGDADKEALKQKNQELYEQLKKAKGLIRGKDGKWVKKEQPKPQPVEKDGMAGVTTEELYSLVKANVPDEDTQEVKLYARSHGQTITEALKSAEVKSLLKVRGELRKTAEASSVTSKRYGAFKPTDEQILADAEEGKLPDAEKLAEVRQRERLSKKIVK